MSAPDIPDKYTITSTIGGSMDVGLDEIRIKELPTITLSSSITSMPDLNANIRIKELPTIVTDNSFSVKELPVIRLETSMAPSRLHFPSHYEFCVSFLGTELLKFGFCGESMMVVEPYKPLDAERCG